jgi:SpoVK/Ycf46/Vps4 family AAA+-type ATPase
MTDITPTPERDPHARWKFFRDVLVFEAKLALNNLHNFFQIPLTIAVAVFDLIAGGKEEGARFYKLVEVGRTIDDAIDIYSIIEHRERSLNRDYTVDALVQKLEGVIVKEYEKGGTAASVKQALDRAIDQMQAKTGDHLGKAGDAVTDAAEKLHEAMRKMAEKEPPPQP